MKHKVADTPKLVVCGVTGICVESSSKERKETTHYEQIKRKN